MRTEGPWSINDIQYWSNKRMWALPALPPIGSYYQGGYYFGNIFHGSSQYGLVAASVTGGILFPSKTPIGVPFGINDLSSETNGYFNTYDVLDLNSGSFGFCKSLSLNGYMDWYLPSKDELYLLMGGQNMFPANERIFHDNETGWWSSTEFGTNTMWYFSSTIYSNGYKSDQYHTRAIRRFPI